MIISKFNTIGWLHECVKIVIMYCLFDMQKFGSTESLKSCIQLHPEKKITSLCNRLLSRKWSLTILCTAWRNSSVISVTKSARFKMFIISITIFFLCRRIGQKWLLWLFYQNQVLDTKIGNYYAFEIGNVNVECIECFWVCDFEWIIVCDKLWSEHVLLFFSY